MATEALAQTRPGSRVVLALPPQDLLHYAIECWERGLVIVPLAPDDPRQDWIVEHSEAALYLGPNKGVRRFDTDPSPSGDAAIVYTSGSTGDPKGVVLSRDGIWHNGLALADRHDYVGLGHGTCLPLYHCNALWGSLIGTHIVGAKFALYHNRPFDPYAYFEALSVYQVGTACVVPAILEKIVSAAPPWPSTLKYLITAAAPLTFDLAQRFHNAYGPGRLVQGYGLSESVNFSFLMPDRQGRDWEDAYLTGENPPVGWPLRDTEFKIADSGEVCVRGPSLMRRYWKNPIETRRVLRDGWLYTGDKGEIRDGYLWLRGRLKETILLGGETLYPADVEERVQGTAFAVEAGSTEQVGLAVDEIRDVWLPKAWTPAVQTTYEVPRTSTGKPQRRKLTEGYATVVINSLDEATEGLAQLVLQHQQRAPKRGVLGCLVLFANFTDDQKATRERVYSLLRLGVQNSEVAVACPTAALRKYWLKTIQSLGVKECGYSILRCGSQDLGGIVFGRIRGPEA